MSHSIRVEWGLNIFHVGFGLMSAISHKIYLFYSDTHIWRAFSYEGIICKLKYTSIGLSWTHPLISATHFILLSLHDLASCH